MPPRLFGYPLLFRERVHGNSGFPPACPISGSVQVTPRFPSSGSRWPRFPAFSSTIRALRLPALAWPSAHWFRQPAPRVPVGFVSALGRSRRRAGPATDRGLDCHAGNPPSSVYARGQEQDLPGSLVTHPVTLRRSTTPDDPLRLACRGASGAAPTRLTMKASSLHRFRGCTPLRHLLSTLHDGRCRTPCKTRFRLAGCAFAGRESNPLDRDERFQLMTSSSPGLRLAQYPFGRAVGVQRNGRPAPLRR